MIIMLPQKQFFYVCFLCSLLSLILAVKGTLLSVRVSLCLFIYLFVCLRFTSFNSIICQFRLTVQGYKLLLTDFCLVLKEICIGIGIRNRFTKLIVD